MDPVLRNLIADERDDELEVVLKLAPGQRDLPEAVRVVARFGEIVTARVLRSRVVDIRELDFVTSVKGGRPITLDEPVERLRRTGMDLHSCAARRTRQYRGRGVVVGAVDFGLDFAHPQFRKADGSTRIKALWNQAGEGRDNHYGYGRIWQRDEINAALTENDPYDALDYNASRTDRGEGAHGTHVCSIAAGKAGIAPEAELIFVDLTTRHTRGRRDLGDSLRVLEGLDFIFREASDSPCVVNCSIGAMGGAKDGLSLVEQAMDTLLTERDGRAICQSTGNYFRSRTHASGQLEDGVRRTFGWEVNEADRSGNELEIWYSGNDEFELMLTPPHGGKTVRAPIGSSQDIVGLQGRIGRIHHRTLDSTNGDNHIDIFLEAHAPTGRYEVEITGLAVSSGRYDAWIERDGSGANQSRFSHEDVDPSLTIGTICTGRMPLVVGAYDGFTENRTPAAFSSRGPTRDGRGKPDLSAPGVGIKGARSARTTDAPGTAGVSYQSGTSMATPHVTGAVALLFEVAGRPLSMAEIREAILSTVDPVDDPEETRLGRGHLAIDAAIRRVEAEDSSEEITMDTDESDAESFPTLGRSQHCNCGETADSDEYVKGALDDNWQDDEVWHDQNWEDDAEEGLGLPDDDEEAWQTEVFEEPHTSPRGANAPFAPEFGPGSYWPLISSSPRGRLVSYRTAGDSMVGFSGRIFGASRSRGARFHVGIDLFGKFGDPVIAIEDGEIIRIYPFCCGRRKTSSALFVAHQNVVVNYGEVNPNSLRDLRLSPGDRVRAGQQIGTVGRNPGGSTMIHFETYLPGTRGNQRWMDGRRRPSRLLNPTRALLNLAETGLDAGSTTRPTPSVTPAVSPPVSPAPSPPQDVGAHSCRSGEGPPAAQPDPSGRGSHPLVRRGTSRTRSRNPSVGFAQQLLNQFLMLLSSGTASCSPGANIADLQRRLGAIGVRRMTVDCRFGPQTEAVTQLFQRCAFPGRPSDWDGEIGPRTWTALLAATTRSSPMSPAATEAPAIPSAPAPMSVPYAVDAARPYGPRWRSTQPPGLPSSARLASVHNGAMADVEQLAGAQGLDATFVAVVRNLAQFESNAIYGLPANIFDARPRAARPPGKSLIAAWGVFQFNRDAWTGLFTSTERTSRSSFVPVGTGGCRSTGGCVFPWDATPDEEIRRPIERYAELYKEIRTAAGRPVDAARGVRLWHATPAGYRRYLANGRSLGFGTAWSQVDDARRHRITRRLEQGGIHAETVYA